MEGESRHSPLRFVRSPGAAGLALIVLLGVGGFLLTSTTIRDDRDDEAERRARVEAVHAQEVLNRARAYVSGLAEVLASERERGQARFALWARATSASVGLNDVLWVEEVPAAPSHLRATYMTRTGPELRPGADVTGFPGLGEAIRDSSRIFAVGASRPGVLGGESGFFLLEAATFADDPGYLVAFVPRGWFSTSLATDPRSVAISQDGERIEGQVDSAGAGADFEMLGRQWRIAVGREPPTQMQSLLPWLALVWPFAVAAVVLPLGRAITQRRHAQREVERIFDLSLDMISILGFDGRFKAVNPAFERTLGYSQQEMLARPFADFVNPDDLDASRDAFAAVLSGDQVTQFQNRYVCADGSERWLEWSATPVPEQRAMYCVARDVTDRRRVDAELREARSTAETRSAEQAALRRVATMVAHERPAEEIFAKVAEEVALLLDVEAATVRRFEPDGFGTIVGRWGALGDAYQVGSSVRQAAQSVTTLVYRTGRSVRFDDYLAEPDIAPDARALRFHAAVASPIVVNGRLWGAIAAGTFRTEPMPADAESRISDFTELVATAISNVQARSDLAASRARIVTAADQERRRLVRDLHDGAQQRLVHTVVTLGLAQLALKEDRADSASLVGEALEHAKRGTMELRELAHGILPGTLTLGGLQAGIGAFLSRLDLPVELDVPDERFPAEVEASTYFVVAEALTNVAKHARAEHAEVHISADDGTLRVRVRDDGIGGADPNGHGLLGMADRVTALGGRLEIDSPPGGGTLLEATLPLAGRPAQDLPVAPPP
jgi:PAS domain S-box-containing protein